MNLRILKKLSNRAAPLLPALGDRRKQFRCTRDEPGDVSIRGMDRKHWRRRVTRNPRPLVMHGDLTAPRRNGLLIVSPPHDAWPRTTMVGETSGYEEPEWSEETAWEALVDYVYWQVAVPYGNDGFGGPEGFEAPFHMTPHQVFRWLREHKVEPAHGY